MWTANASTKETTVTVPTAAEVAEVNPLAYIHGYDANYRIAFSKNREAGKYRILLNPKKEKYRHNGSRHHHQCEEFQA